MNRKLLAFLLSLSLVLAVLPMNAMAEMPEEPMEAIEEAIPELTVELDDIDLDDIGDEVGTPDLPAEAVAEPIESLDSSLLTLAELESFTEGYARVVEALNAVYDEDSVLVAENLPVDAIVYVTGRDAEDAVQVAYSVGTEDIVRGRMDASALAALNEDEVAALMAAAESEPDNYSLLAGDLPLPIIRLEEITETPDVAPGAAIQPNRVAFSVAKLSIGVGQTYDGLEVILGSDPDANYVRDLTFTSSKPKYLTVDEDGVLHGVKKGSSVLTVVTGNGLKATCKVSVKSAPSKITVTPKTLKLNAGETSAMKGKLSSTLAGAVTWTSSDEDVAIVDEATGEVTAVDAGYAVITGRTYNGKSGSCNVTVLAEPTSLTFDEHEMTLGVKQTLSKPARLNPGAECPITYTSSNSNVVKVKGTTLTAVAAGHATITASIYNGLTDTCEITVERAPKSVKLPFKTLNIGEDDTFQLEPVVDGSAIGLTYTSSKPAYATVTQDGLITALKAGTTYVTIKTYNKKRFKLKVVVQKAPTSVTISPKELDLGVGEVSQLNCKVPSGSYASITLESSDPSVVEVDSEKGTVTAVGLGSATVTAETYNGLTDTCEITVYPAPTDIAFVDEEIELAVKDTYEAEIEMIGGHTAVTYSIDNTSIATVSSTGVVTGKKAGSTTLHAKTRIPGLSAEVPVTVWGVPSSVKFKKTSIQVGIDESYELEPIIPANTRTTFTYSSNNTRVAEVDEDGVIYGNAMGSATITVKTHNGKTAKVSVSVVDPYYPTGIELEGEMPDLEVDETWFISYSIIPATADAELTWSSSDKKVVTVDDFGEIYAVGPGTATITAVAEENPKCKLTVKVKVLGHGGGGGSYSYGDIVTAIPERITDIGEIDDNLAMIEDIHQCAQGEIDRMEDEDIISSSDANKRRSIIDNIFENYAFPWMTLRYQDYWKAANSEGGVKDFKPGNVYYGLPYISGSGKNRYYNVEKALSENRYYDSGEGYYIMNQNNLVSGKYVGNDCSGLVDVSIWGTNDSHSDDRTKDIASSSAYRTISDWKAMRTGDLICKGGSHVVMFLYYVDDDKTEFMMIENGGAEPGTNTVHCDIYDASYYISGGYKIRRLKSLG